MARLEDVLLVDTRGAQPVATAVPAGTLYAVSDENFLIEQSDGATWSQYGPTPGGGANAVTAAGTLTASRLVLGAGTKTVAEMGSLGTTTTLLHGNAAGAPTFGAVTLTTDVTGVLPVANGGTGSASGAGIRRVSVALTDAEIKALPTSSKLILAAQGAGFIVVPQFFLVQIRAAAGAYTNIHASSSARFETATTNKLVSGYIANDAGTTPVLSQMTQLFGNASNRQLLLTADFFTVNESAGWSTFGDVQIIGDLENRDIQFAVSNTGGNFTGGNAANTGRILMYYTVETI